MKFVRVTTTYEGRSLTTCMSAHRNIRSLILWTLKKNKASTTQANLFGAFPVKPDGGEAVQIPAELTLKRYLAQLEKNAKSFHHHQQQQTSSSSSSSSTLSLATIVIAVRKTEAGDESGNSTKLPGKTASSSRSKEILTRIGDFFSIKKSTRLDRTPKGKTLKKLFGSPSGRNEVSRAPFGRKCDWLPEDVEKIRSRNILFKDERLPDQSSICGGYRNPDCERISACYAPGKEFYALSFRQYNRDITANHGHWISSYDLPTEHLMTAHHRRRTAERCPSRIQATQPFAFKRGETTNSYGANDGSNVSVASRSRSNIRLSMGVSQRILKSKQNLSFHEASKTLNQSTLTLGPVKRELLLDTSTPDLKKPKSIHGLATTSTESDTSSVWASPLPPADGSLRPALEADLSAVNDVSDAESEDSVFQVTSTSIEADLSIPLTTPVKSRPEVTLPPLRMKRKRFFTDLTE